MTPFAEMALNNAWANATLYGAMAGMDDATFAAPRPGFFPSLKETMNHLYEVDLYYLDALTEGGLGRQVYDRSPEGSVTQLGAQQAEAGDASEEGKDDVVDADYEEIKDDKKSA